MSRRNSVLKAALLLFPAILFGSLFLKAEDNDPYPTGPEAGRKLAAELRAIKPDESTNFHGTLVILGRGRKTLPVPINWRVTSGETNWTVTYLTAPTDTNVAEEFTVIFSTNAPNQYFYARATKPGALPGEPKPISAAQADVPIGGSDFWLSDLGLEFLHWPDQVRLRGDIHNNRGRYVLVSSNPHPAPGGYSRVKTWFDKESGQPVQGEAWGENTNRVMKSFSVESVAKAEDGRYQVKKIEISTEGKSRTRLEIAVDGDKKKQ